MNDGVSGVPFGKFVVQRVYNCRKVSPECAWALHSLLEPLSKEPDVSPASPSPVLNTHNQLKRLHSNSVGESASYQTLSTGSVLTLRFTFSNTKKLRRGIKRCPYTAVLNNAAQYHRCHLDHSLGVQTTKWRVNTETSSCQHLILRSPSPTLRWD